MAGGGNPQQTTTTQLSPQQQQLFNLAMPGVTSYAASPPPAPQVAGFTPTQTQAQSDIMAGAKTAGGVQNWATSGVTGLPDVVAQNTGTPFVAPPTAPQSSNIFNDPGIWNVDYNTGLKNAIEAAQRPTYQALTDVTLPAIGGTAVTAGGYGGSRQGIAEGLASGRASQTAQDAADKIVEDVYGQNLAAVNNRYNTNVGADVTQRGQDISADTARYGTDAQRASQNIQALLATYGLAPSLESQAFVPGQAEAAVGDVQQQQQQNELNAKLIAQYAPFLQSKDILSLLQGTPGGSVTSTGNSPTGNPITAGLGGAASGAALGAAFGGVGAVPGAIVGGLAGTLPFLLGNQKSTV